MPPSESTLSTFTSSDGDNLAMRDWPAPERVSLRGVAVLVHGLGEHAGRYDGVARHLNEWGFAVRGYDQYGHGESDGVRGGLPVAQRLVEDLADVIDSTRHRMERGLPLVVIGHSVGGLVAASAALLPGVRIDGLVLSSPAFDAGANWFQQLLLATLPRVAPRIRVSNGVDPRHVSRDPAVVAQYRRDPLVHDRVCARLARFVVDTGPQVLARAAQWRIPTLLMYAGADRVVRPAGSRAFAEAAPRQVVTSRCFEGLYHEIFNEPENAEVFFTLRRWLDANF